MLFWFLTISIVYTEVLGIAKLAFGNGATERYFGLMEVSTFDELHKTKKIGEVCANCINNYYKNF